MRRCWSRWEDERGFTLVELMVVVLIIGILVAIALPTFLGARQRAQNRAVQADLRNGLSAAKVFYTQAGTYTGFTAAVAESIEPSQTWAVAATTLQTRIGIRVEGGTRILLQKESRSTHGYCIVDNTVGATAGVTTGRNTTGGNFATAAACTAAPDW